MKFLRKSFFCLCLFAASQTFGEDKKITVVGAGLAGLTAAYRIETLTGLDVDVYEARSRPGGRAFTIEMNGHLEELGGKFLNDGGEAENIKALIEEMGLELDSYELDRSHRKFVFQGMLGDYYSIYKQGKIPDDSTYAELASLCKKSKNLGEVLDHFFEGSPLIRHLVEIRMRGYEGNDCKSLSVAYLNSFWEFYKSAHERPDNDYIAEVIKSGTGSLVEKLTAALHKSVHYNMPLKKISNTSSGRILLHFDEQVVETDFLILALPISTLRDVEIEGIFPEDQMDAIAALQYGTNGKILLPYPQQIDTSECHVTNDCIVWMDKERSILTCFSGGMAGCFDSHSIEGVTNQVQSEIPSLKLLFPSWSIDAQPELLEDRLFASYRGPVAISWINEKYSKGSYSSWGADQYELFNEKEVHFGEKVRKVFRPVQGKIFIAGEHAALEFPSTLEGAVESGERTAKMVINAL